MAWNKNKRQNSQNFNSKKNYFWITCKDCGAKMAIPPSWIEKYLERVMPGYERED